MMPLDRPNRFVILFSAGMLILLLSAGIHFEKTLDFRIQRFFFSKSGWLIDEGSDLLRGLLYQFPRTLPWIAGIAVFCWKWRDPLAWRAVGFIAALPLLTNFLKSVTAQACPKEFILFSGTIADSAIFTANSRCFPGGHASAGFALLGVCLAVENVSFRRKLGFGVTVWGFTLAFYQVARGLHFFSDGLATFGLAVTLYSLFRRWPADQYSQVDSKIAV